jgi:hypothetical protein
VSAALKRVGYARWNRSSFYPPAFNIPTYSKSYLKVREGDGSQGYVTLIINAISIGNNFSYATK